MKLVDILARELNEWPHPGDALGQASDATLHLNEYAGHGGVFYGWTQVRFTKAQDSSEAFVTRAQWQASVDALKAKEVVDWNGEGLPPVGTVCEFQGDCAKCPSDPWHKELHDGVRCTVIAHFKSKSLDLVAFTFVKSDGNSELEQSLPGALSPIRTPEQIAAEELKRYIGVMIADMKGRCSPDQAKLLFKAGYRKQEQE